MQINKYNTAHKQNKDKNYIISIDSGKACDKIKGPEESGNRRDVPQQKGYV
jgi:hypothetical protein